ncbi:MAG: primosomal protein N' (replication factor Y) [Planctomycetota bacterium]|jgi:primosomal protein N' (replication factor Y)
MYIIDVITLELGLPGETLSYFYSEDLAMGTVVEVPFRTTSIKAIAIASKPLIHNKIAIKQASYQMKSILTIHQERICDPAFIRTVLDVANLYLISPQSVFTTLFPKHHSQSFKNDIVLPTWQQPKSEDSQPLLPDTTVLQYDHTERIAYYQTLARRLFSQQQSMVICVPQIALIHFWKEHLPLISPERITVLHGSLTPKQIQKSLTHYHEQEAPQVAIMTPSYLYAMRSDTGTVILEEEGSTQYLRHIAPFIDLRVFANRWCHNTKTKLIRADSMVSLGSIHNLRNSSFHEQEKLSYRLATKHATHIVSLQKKPEVAAKDYYGRYVFDKKVLDALEHTSKKGQNSFIFVPRTGLSPLTTCRDCGSSVLCPYCNKPINLHTHGSGQRYMCHHCSRDIPTDHLCKSCDGHNFFQTGIGTETAVAELAKLAPGLTTFLTDSHHTRTFKKTLQMINEWRDTPGGVLIGTNQALPYLYDKVDLVIVASIDALAVLPEYYAYENIARLLIHLSEITNKNLILQTRHTPKVFSEFFDRGSFLPFLEEEYNLRGEHHYPPHTVLVQATLPGSSAHTTAITRHLQALFPLYNITPLQPDTQNTSAGGCISIPTKDWYEYQSDPDHHLISRAVAEIRQYYQIRVIILR